MAAEADLPPAATPRRRFGFRLPAAGAPWFSGFILILLVVCAVGGDALTPWNPAALDLRANFQPPVWAAEGSWAHPLGTDNLGRDILSRIIAGARVSLVVSLWAIVLSGGIGSLAGMIAGYFGGWADAIIMRLVDVQMSIPALALALILAAVLEPGLETVVIVIVVTYWTWYARIVRGEILSLKERDYVALAKVAGVSSFTIFHRHLAPNIVNTMLVLATLQIGQVIIFEASLSFLGLGIQSPAISWGLMLADARAYLTNAWWAITMPGIAIMLVCLSSNLFGDWLRDVLDPRRKQL
ncbi:ABC transporter permease [Albimonas sp. CAU 1670]|uniref:ABC transporter permease n=1 Tax=Albimonas sp. CAU 1670 TaxID=3032599 RepID=UPI0023DAF481|nr:ABC transporter permease [Albimonas sp. CAU 1670]MDF2233362.1 ABC transporter permease [Albimonas sp. CAU 1670]